MKSEDLRICFIGDSFVHGVGDPECLGWTGRVSAAARRNGYHLTSYNLGIRRDTSSDIARRWLDEAQRRLPTTCRPFVVFSFGANDATLEHGEPRVSEDQSIENTRRILSGAKAHYPVAMIGPPPMEDADRNTRIRRLSNLLAAVAGQQEVPFLPVFEPLALDPVWMSEVRAGDGAHPGAGGYARLAALIEAWSPWWFR